MPHIEHPVCCQHPVRTDKVLAEGVHVNPEAGQVLAFEGLVLVQENHFRPEKGLVVLVNGVEEQLVLQRVGNHQNHAAVVFAHQLKAKLIAGAAIVVRLGVVEKWGQSHLVDVLQAFLTV